MHFDLLIVGGGPSGLAAAIHAAQYAHNTGQALSICLIDKGAEVGAHILSGAIIDTRALQMLLPDWRSMKAPLETPVTQNHLLWLEHDKAKEIPSWLIPSCLHNQTHFIGSLGLLCRWLAEHAETLGVEIYPGFTATEILYDKQGAVSGVATGDMGLLSDGSQGPGYAAGMHLTASYTLFAEGARGHLGKQLEKQFELRANTDYQTFSLGLKELWRIPQTKHLRGQVFHTAGWPMQNTTGGGFLYHYGEDLVAIGLVMGLGYSNPWLSPFDEFQRLKMHPAIRPHLEDGKRLEYGARVLPTGGPQALPKLVFPGGALLGDNAGFLDPARLKGIHGAMASGMMAGHAAVEAIISGRKQDVLTLYPETWQKSEFAREFEKGRNFKPLAALHHYIGPLLAGIDQTILRGHAPWTLHSQMDRIRTKSASNQPRINYPTHYSAPAADKASSVFLANIHYTDNQPCHLKIKSPKVSFEVTFKKYASPEVRYCPAGVYEMIEDPTGNPRLHINASNCLHCKACDIKDPTGNIEWTAPQGGEGPLYTQM